MYLVNQLHSDCFDNLNIVENVVDCFFCDWSMSVFTAYSHSNRGEVSSLAR